MRGIKTYVEYFYETIREKDKLIYRLEYFPLLHSSSGLDFTL